MTKVHRAIGWEIGRRHALCGSGRTVRLSQRPEAITCKRCAAASPDRVMYDQMAALRYGLSMARARQLSHYNVLRVFAALRRLGLY